MLIHNWAATGTIPGMILKISHLPPSLRVKLPLKTCNSTLLSAEIWVKIKHLISSTAGQCGVLDKTISCIMKGKTPTKKVTIPEKEQCICFSLEQWAFYYLGEIFVFAMQRDHFLNSFRRLLGLRFYIHLQTIL